MGDSVRDWQLFVNEVTLFPYDDKFLPIVDDATHPCLKFLWIARTSLANNKMFAGKTKVDCGLHWYEFGRLTAHKLMTPLSIVFANIATHFHAYLDRGGSLFNTTSPLIKLRSDASEDDHLLILGYLDSSAACFCMKQVSHEKQMMGGESIRIESKAKVPYAFSSTQLGKLPMPEALQSGILRERLIVLSRRMDSLATRLGTLTPQVAIARGLVGGTSIHEIWGDFECERLRTRSQMVLIQEEIDFTVYAMWGFADRSLLSMTIDWPEVALDAGGRPFEILRGRNEDDFPVLERIPSSWPTELRDLWQRRMDAITGSSELRLIEDAHYKRRWIGRQGKYNLKREDNAFRAACIEWLLDRLESYFDFDGRMNDAGQPTAKLDIALVSIAKLADVARQDTEFQQVGELFRDDPAFEVQALVNELVAAECVPLLPVLRYKPSGLIKRGTWERTWHLQRQEDEYSRQLSVVSGQLENTRDPAETARLKAELVRLTAESKKFSASIPVPTKYDSKDFLTSDFWRLRGKLDVPKERWVSFPLCDGPDGTMMLCWAGYDHLQQARAISAYYVQVQTEFGGSDDPRLIPLLACLIELLPWLKQWHNDLDPEFNMSMGDYFEGFINEEARQLGKTLQEIKDWAPPAKTRGSTSSRTRGRKRME